MNGRVDADRILDAFLAPDNDRVADRVIDAALASIARTPQRRAVRVPWRFTHMNHTLRLASAALVAVVAVGGVAYLLGSRGPGATATPSPTLAPASSPIPTIGPPAFDVPFSSPTYGYDALMPAAWAIDAGVAQGTAETLALGGHSGSGQYWDHFRPQESAAVGILATSASLPVGMTEEAWIAAYQDPQVEEAGRACIPERAAWEEVTIDGRLGGFYVGCSYVEAMVFVDRRVYVFYYVNTAAAQADTERTGRAVLRAFLETVSLRPEQVSTPPPSGS